MEKRQEKNEEQDIAEVDMCDSQIQHPMVVNFNRLNYSLQFLNDKPQFTEINIASWHESIVHLNNKLGELNEEYGDDHTYAQKLENMCMMYEQVRVKFDIILKEQYPSLKTILLQQFNLRHKNDKPLPQQLKITECRFFEYGSEVNEKEDRQIEFKNYQLSSFENIKFREIIKKTITSFLNQQGGTIFIGIRDYDMTVQGVDLTKKDMDDMKLRVSEIRRQIEPDCNLLVNVDFIPIKRYGRFAKGKWVVRIKVSQGELNSIYAFETSRGNEQDSKNPNISNIRMFQSAFREDGSSSLFELSKFLQTSKEIHLNGRQQASPINYAMPDKDAYKSETQKVQYQYERNIGEANFSNNSNQTKVQKPKNSQLPQGSSIQKDKQYLNSELKQQAFDNELRLRLEEKDQIITNLKEDLKKCKDEQMISSQSNKNITDLLADVKMFKMKYEKKKADVKELNYKNETCMEKLMQALDDQQTLLVKMRNLSAEIDILKKEGISLILNPENSSQRTKLENESNINSGQIPKKDAGFMLTSQLLGASELSQGVNKQSIQQYQQPKIDDGLKTNAGYNLTPQKYEVSGSSQGVNNQFVQQYQQPKTDDNFKRNGGFNQTPQTYEAQGSSQGVNNQFVLQYQQPKIDNGFKTNVGYNSTPQKYEALGSSQGVNNQFAQQYQQPKIEDNFTRNGGFNQTPQTYETSGSSQGVNNPFVQQYQQPKIDNGFITNAGYNSTPQKYEASGSSQGVNNQFVQQYQQPKMDDNFKRDGGFNQTPKTFEASGSSQGVNNQFIQQYQQPRIEDNFKKNGGFNQSPDQYEVPQGINKQQQQHKIDDGVKTNKGQNLIRQTYEAQGQSQGVNKPSIQQNQQPKIDDGSKTNVGCNMNPFTHEVSGQSQGITNQYLQQQQKQQQPNLSQDIQNKKARFQNSEQTNKNSTKNNQMKDNLQDNFQSQPQSDIYPPIPDSETIELASSLGKHSRQQQKQPNTSSKEPGIINYQQNQLRQLDNQPAQSNDNSSQNLKSPPLVISQQLSNNQKNEPTKVIDQWDNDYIQQPIKLNSEAFSKNKNKQKNYATQNKDFDKQDKQIKNYNSEKKNSEEQWQVKNNKKQNYNKKALKKEQQFEELGEEHKSQRDELRRLGLDVNCSVDKISRIIAQKEQNQNSFSNQNKQPQEQKIEKDDSEDDDEEEKEEDQEIEEEKEEQSEVPTKYDKVSKEMLQKYKYWIVMVFIYEHDVADAKKQLQKCSKDENDFSYDVDQRIISSFFKNYLSMKHAYDQIMDNKINFTKLIWKNKQKDNLASEQIYFNTSPDQLKEKDGGATQPIIYLDNINTIEENVLKNIFNKPIIRKYKKQIIFLSIEANTLYNLKRKQINNIIKDKNNKHIGFVIGTSICLNGLSDRNKAYDLLLNVFSESIVFGESKIKTDNDNDKQITIEFNNSVDALIGYFRINESKICDIAPFFKSSNKIIELEQVFKVPVDHNY